MLRIAPLPRWKFSHAPHKIADETHDICVGRFGLHSRQVGSGCDEAAPQRLPPPILERIRCKSVPVIFCHRLVDSQKLIYDTSRTVKY